MTLNIFQREEMNTKNTCILHVEDDENDVILLQHAFEEAGISNPVHVASDGKQAIDYLAMAARGTDPRVYPMPCLVLLDLKIPFISGLDVLHWARQQTGLVDLPIIVLTSSENPTDVSLAYKFGANSFVVKPFEREERLRLAQGLNLWWIEKNLCPENSNHRSRDKREPLAALNCA